MYDNAHLYILSIFLRLDISSLTKIQYFQIEPSEKGTYTSESEKGTYTNESERGTYTNESMMLKFFI